MGMTEKKSLIDAITIKMVEDYNTPLKEVKAKITLSVLKNPREIGGFLFVVTK